MCYWPVRVLLIIVSCLILWFVKSALDNGVVRVKGNHLINKKDSPANYWLFVGTYIMLGIGGILFAVFAGFIK